MIKIYFSIFHLYFIDFLDIKSFITVIRFNLLFTLLYLHIDSYYKNYLLQLPFLALLFCFKIIDFLVYNYYSYLKIQYLPNLCSVNPSIIINIEINLYLGLVN